MTVGLDDGANDGVAVEGAAAEPGAGGDGGERDGVSVSVELGAGAFDPVEGVAVGHPVRASLIKVSSRVMRR